MNQQKTGEFLKHLRKTKGLTQEQLAEKFYVSSRTVSRWETGSNMPDLSVLVELADFYDVDIREIIDGERKGENMDKETKDTLKKVAEYAAEKESKSQSKVLHIALGVCIVLIVCTVLFSTGPGLLCGIISENVCLHIMTVIYGLALFLLVAYLRVLPFMEKPSSEPEKTIGATVISKEVRSGTQGSGRSMMGYSFVVNFQTEDGQMLELYAYETEFGGLKEGSAGILTYQGRYFVDFQKDA
jgi:transcriptional regulator with XRE-family HTH domain